MTKLKKLFNKKQILWIAVVVIVIAAATGYAVVPKISLNSPTSFPVDI